MNSGYQPWQEEELRKCEADFTYFASNYVKIIHPMKGLVSFDLYEFQKRVVGEFEKHQFNIIKKFRQAGLTTVAVIWVFWRCMFKFQQRIMLLSKSDREAIGVGKIIQSVKDNLPAWMQPMMGNDNDREKEFKDTQSVLWFYTCAAARSKALTYLIIDEAAFIPNMEDHWKAMYPTLSTGGNCIVISTVNGIGNWYEETWHRAEDKKNQFNIINLDYREHPDYQSPEWAKKMKANLGDKGWAQEILGSFLNSGDTFIGAEHLNYLEKCCIDPIIKMFPEYDTSPIDEYTEEEVANENYEKGAMWVWKDPQPGKEYIICADASQGVSHDNSAFHVLDMQTFEQIAEFYSNEIPVHKFAQVLNESGKFYNDALIVIDHDNGSGHAVINRLQTSLHYENLYFDHSKNRDKPGLTLTKSSRPLVMEALQTCILNKLVRLRSRRLIRELKTFIFNKGKQRPEALKGKTDDLVMALAIGLYVSDISTRENPIGADIMQNKISQALGKNLEQIRRELESGLPDDFFDDEEDVQFEDLMPRMMLRDEYRRPGDALLREFGM